MIAITTVLHRCRRACLAGVCALLAAFALSALPASAIAQDRDPAYAEFYETLDQNGEWIVHPRYGQTWVPYANDDRDWRPYSRGQWVYTDEHGWYWESEEEWGWVTYHYGRWLLDERHGWMWVPGREWGPAWVAWREGEDTIGWAPLPPEAEFEFADGSVATFDAYDSPGFAPLWIFVRPAMMLMPSVYRYCHPPRQNALYFGRTRFVTHYAYRDRRIYNRGIDRRFIEGHTRRPVPVLQVRPLTSSRDIRAGRFDGERRTVGVYRPQIAARSNRDDQPRPPFAERFGGRPGMGPSGSFGRREGRPDGDRFEQPRRFGREPGFDRGAPPDGGPRRAERPDGDRFDQPRRFGREPGMERSAPSPDTAPRRAERPDAGRFDQPRPPMPGYGRGPGSDHGAPADGFGRRQGPPAGGFDQPRQLRPPQPPQPPGGPPAAGPPRSPPGPPAGLGARPPAPPATAPPRPHPQVNVPAPRPQVQAPPARPQVQAPTARKPPAPAAPAPPGAGAAGR